MSLRLPVRFVLIALGLLCAAVYGLWTVFHWGGPEAVARIANTPLMLPCLVTTALACWRARGEVQLEARRGWGLFAFAFALYSLATAIWAAYTLSGRGIPFPSLADVLYLTFPWLFLASLIVLTRAQLSKLERQRILSSTAIMLGAVGLVQWTLLLRTTVAVSAQSPLALVVGLLYPLGDLVMVGGLLFGALLTFGSLRQPFLLPMMLGAALFVTGNFIYAVQISAGTYQAATPLDLTWTLGTVLFDVAALLPGRAALTEKSHPKALLGQARAATLSTTVLLLSALFALGKLVVSPQSSLSDGVVTFLALLLITSAAFWRQRLEVRENAQLTHELQTINASLEARVRGAVEELEHRNGELEAQTQAFRRANEETNARTREVTLLNELGDLLQMCVTFEEAFTVIGRLTPHFFPASSGALYLTSASRNVAERSARWGEGELEQVFAPEDCWALRRGREHLFSESGTAPRCNHLGTSEGGSSLTHLCVPLTAQGETLGLLYLNVPDGATTWVEGSLRLARTVADAIALALSNLRLRETLRHQSIRDPLTGLYNRRYLEETLERELSRSARGDTPVSLLVFDVDHFKRFNDTFGHDAGDTVLRELGGLVREQLRGGDIACRYGGEEFVVVLPGVSLEVAESRAEALREAVKRLGLSHRNASLGTVSLSIGVACFPQHGNSGEALIRAADEALYRAKREGRDRVVTVQVQFRGNCQS